jgi:hypothetical protein
LKPHAILILLFACALGGSSIPAAAQSFSGGIVEKAFSAGVRPKLTAAQIQSFLPAKRGKFKFPAPYNTEGIRLTTQADCGGKDCLAYVGYSYWMNINNHTGSDTMLIFLALDRRAGGTGPTLFSYNKVTDEVKNLGALFDPASPFSWHHGAGWYFSATQPTKLYVYNDSPQLFRYDVLAKTFQTVFDVGARFGADKDATQMHSSADDRIHSATLRCKKAGCADGARTAIKEDEAMGCVVYNEPARQFSYYPRKGKFDECQVDASGRWLVTLEELGGKRDEMDNRIIDLQTGAQRTLLYDQEKSRGTDFGRVAHIDMGYGYMIGTDAAHKRANAKLLYRFDKDPLKGELMYYTHDWSTPAPNHVTHRNARADLPVEQQYACGSDVNRDTKKRADEIVCFRLDGSLASLVVAPVMTDPDASGKCDDYCKQPKGNLDVTGRYFIWTSNMGGNRLDAFIVKVPAQLLVPNQVSGKTAGAPALPAVR